MAACRQCGSELAEGARFCSACGSPVETLERDERKVVSVVFVDLVGSTEIGDGRDPEELRDTVRPTLLRMRAELERYGGTFEKNIGDAVMAVFGAPVSHEDDAERAVRAALAIRDAIPGVRAAVNTGEALVSLQATSGAAEGIATGDVVNSAFRIEEAAPADSVLVGETTYRATASAIEYGDRKLLQAKGKVEPIAVYEALRPNPAHRPLDERAPLAPLVGRRDELSLILSTLSRARRDRTVQLLTLTGPPGIGKSRLLWELRNAVEGEPGLVTWRRGRCLAYGDGVAFWALSEMVKAQAGILETDDAAAAGAKLARATRDLIADTSEAAHVERHLRPLAGLAPDAPERRDEAFGAWRRCFEALADWGPLVLAFEDLHWADAGLLDFLEHLADWGRGPMLILCTARPEIRERRPSWGARANSATIALAPLSGEETELLVSHLLRQAVVPPDLQRTLLARAEGNPLYAEELVRMLVDRGLFVRGDSGWQLREADIPLPESVQGIIAARLDALAPEEKALLQAASVLGRTFWSAGLSAVSGGRDPERVLRDLERKEFVRRQRSSSLAGEEEYVFHHALVRDVAYAQTPRRERARRHVEAAEWLATVGRAEDNAETIAHHYLCAVELGSSTQPDDALAAPARHWLREAGTRAFSLNAFGPAARYFEGALRFWPRDDPARYELLLRLGETRFAASAEGRETIEEAVAGLRDHGRKARAAEGEVLLGRLAWLSGSRELTHQHLEAARGLVASEPASPEKARVLAWIASTLMLENVYGPALEAAHEALEMSRSLGLLDVEGQLLTTIGSAKVRAGDEEGFADLERSVALLEEARSPAVALAHMRIAAAHVEHGDLRRAAAAHERARRAVERSGDAPSREWLDAERVGELYWAGELDEALAAADSFLARVEAGGQHYLESFCRCLRGRMRLALGDVGGAADDARRAIDVALLAGDSQIRVPAHAFSARVRAAQGDVDAAGAEASAALAELTGVESGEHCWPDFAVVLVESGRSDELLEAVRRLPKRTLWRDAAAAYAQGDYDGAADLYARIGSRPDEEDARRRARVIRSAR